MLSNFYWRFKEGIIIDSTNSEKSVDCIFYGTFYYLSTVDKQQYLLKLVAGICNCQNLGTHFTLIKIENFALLISSFLLNVLFC